MRVLGVDPGSRFMGFGAVEEREGKPWHLGHGVLRAAPTEPLEKRLKTLFEQLTAAVREYRPDVIAVEGVFTLKNARSALVLGHARAVALLVAAQSELAVHEYAPARVKKAVGAGGGADKETVARCVKRFLSIESLARADATDALAVAICHLNRVRVPLPSSGARGAGAVKLAEWRERLQPSYRRFGGS